MDEKTTDKKTTKAKKPKIIETICPGCGKPVETHKCRFCGSTKTINQVSGNEIWMKNGRIVQAFKDSKQAYVKMATKYNIPREQWPEEFRGVK